MITKALLLCTLILTGKSADYGTIGSVYVRPVSDVPQGFLECNGAEHKRVDYPKLYDVLGGTYGERSENGEIYFNIPDYRGYFLRGWDHGASRDPDRHGRSNRGDGATGDVVGTKQNDALQGHWHQLYSYDEVVAGWGGAGRWESGHVNNHFIGNDAVKNPVSNGADGTPRTSPETRPTNIYVMYIIQAREITNYVTQNDFTSLQGNINTLTTQYNNDIATLQNEANQVKATQQSDFSTLQGNIDTLTTQHNNDIATLQNETNQIKATQQSDFDTLQDNLATQQSETHLNFSNLKQEVMRVNTTCKGDITSLQERLLAIEQWLNATASPTPAPVNSVPVVAQQIAKQYATIGELFEYTVPQETFTDVDNDQLTPSATLIDDSALPQWLYFNADTWEFLGRPTVESAGDVFIKLTVTDPAGAQASEAFSIIVQETTSSSAPQNTSDRSQEELGPLNNRISNQPIAIAAIIVASINTLCFLVCLYYLKKKPADKEPEQSNIKPAYNDNNMDIKDNNGNAVLVDGDPNTQEVSALIPQNNNPNNPQIVSMDGDSKDGIVELTQTQ